MRPCSRWHGRCCVKKTVFNYVATYNDFERAFAKFLDDDKASDVLRFAALGTTEQGEAGTQFRVDYLKPSGAIGFYHPDWVVVQKVGRAEVNWIADLQAQPLSPSLWGGKMWAPPAPSNPT